MKNTLLCGALLILTNLEAQAASPSEPATPSPNVQAVPVQTIKQQPIQQIPTTKPQTLPTINCNYKISRETKTIEQALVLTWSKQAVVQSFDFDPAHLEQQLEQLQACFTESGWAGFKSALDKSGNVAAIKSQQLTVSSQIDGETQMVEDKDNQWKVSLPLQVVYQNDKEKVTQLLDVTLIITRKITGDLGIVQMIATPRAAANAPEAPTNNTPTTH